MKKKPELETLLEKREYAAVEQKMDKKYFRSKMYATFKSGMQKNPNNWVSNGLFFGLQAINSVSTAGLRILTSR